MVTRHRVTFSCIVVCTSANFLSSAFLRARKNPLMPVSREVRINLSPTSTSQLVQRRRPLLKLNNEAFSFDDELFKFPDGNSQSSHSQSHPAMGNDLAEVKARLEQADKEYQEASSKAGNQIETAEPDEDGVFLDADQYLQSSREQNEGTDDENIYEHDASHKQSLQNWIQNAAPNSPTAQSAGSNNNNPSLEDLMSAMSEQQQRLQSSPTESVSQTLHDEIFAAEQAFLDQSEEFRASLLDSSKADEAAALRNGQEFRERQQEAIEQLNENLNEFEKQLATQQSNTAKEAPRCKKCSSALDSYEINAGKKFQECCRVCHAEYLVETSLEVEARSAARSKLEEQRGRTMSESPTTPQTGNFQKPRPKISRRVPIQPAKPTTTENTGVGRKQARAGETPRQPSQVDLDSDSLIASSWRKVTDQETGDIFYWNEDTEEMQWDDPDDPESNQ